VAPFLAHVQEAGVPCDFVSTHVYGSPPLDLRPLLAEHGLAALPLLWTEWGPSPTHFAAVNDSVLSAAFVARGMRSASGRVDALAPWVASDHFEELGRPPALMHGGFGLLSVGNLAKPRFWALWMLEQLGPAELTCRLDGDGAGALVEAWSSLDPDSGRVCVVLWNSTLDQSVLERDASSVALLDRSVALHVSGLRDGAYTVRHRHLAPGVSDLGATAAALGVQGWPTGEQWAALRAADHLVERSCDVVESVGGQVSLEVAMVMPSMALVELVPR
jgi:xylan 1,4-beta-xylosidase